MRQRLKVLLTTAANAVPLGLGIGIISGLCESHRQGYLSYGATSLVLRAIANHSAVAMVAAVVVAPLAALAAWTLSSRLHPVWRWLAVVSVLLVTPLILINPGSTIPVEFTRYPVTTAALCVLAVVWLISRAPVGASRWGRRIAVVPVIGGLLIAVSLYGVARVRRERTAAVTNPNVVLIVIDTCRADHLSVYGYDRSTAPRLEQLARQSTLYTRAYAQAPWTSPSVSALLTSRYPGEFGYDGRARKPVLERRFHTFAELLWEAGYETHAFVSNMLLGRKLGFDQGFDGYSELHARGKHYVSSRHLIADSIRYLDAARRPFFLFVHLFDSHFEYIEHPEHVFSDPYSGWLKSGLPYEELLRRADEFQPEDLARLLSVYDSEIAFTDEHVGQLLEALQTRGLFDASWIIVTADHGEAFLDRSDGVIGHGKTLYNELLRVPLIVKRPGQRESVVVDSPVGLVDVLPTVAGAVGLSLPGVAAGSTLPLATAAVEPGTARPVFAETRMRDVWLQSAILGDWKLIVDRKAGEVELFDLSADPLERTDLSLREVEIERALKKAIDAWDSELGKSKRGSVAEASFSDEELRNLKALGYLD